MGYGIFSSNTTIKGTSNTLASNSAVGGATIYTVPANTWAEISCYIGPGFTIQHATPTGSVGVTIGQRYLLSAGCKLVLGGSGGGINYLVAVVEYVGTP